jgi:SAM-dependent methyltransferase
MNDPFEKAFFDYLEGDKSAEITVHCNKGDDEVIPISYFFRDYDKMPQLEKEALKLCIGSILDIGAGSGIHSLHLQNIGNEITALDIKPGFVKVMKKRGLSNVIQSDIFDFNKGKFDTLLMLMNGIGFTKNFDGLSVFLKQAKELLLPGGQLLLDSSDLLYLYEDDDGSYSINLNDRYYGEVEYIIEYKEALGKAFDWLYIDFDNLSLHAEQAGFRCELIFDDDHYNYLARLY